MRQVCGKDVLTWKRSGLVFGVMVVGVALLLWAGWHNLRERRLAMQKAQENHVVLVPEGQEKSQAGGGASSTESEAPTMRGKVAPNFSLVTLDGKKVSLSDFKGRPVLVNFWATWCGPCKVEMPWFEEFHKQYAAQGLEILGLADDVDAGKEAIGKVAQKTGVTYPILLTDGKVQTAYGGLDYLPMSFYVDRKGVIIEETAGLGSKDEIEAHIKKMIASGAAPAGWWAVMGRRVAGLMLALLGAMPLAAQQVGSLDAPAAKPKGHVVYAAEQQSVKAGKPGTLELRFKVDDGFHVNSHTPKSELLIPTAVTLQPADGVKASAVVYPAGTSYSFSFEPNEKLDVYTGEFVVKLPVVAEAGAHTIDGTLRYQACDHAACYPPKSLPVQVLFTAK